MNKMLSEAKTLRNIEPKHFFLVLKRTEDQSQKDEEIFDENLTSSEPNQNILVQSENFVSSQNNNEIKEKSDIRTINMKELFINTFFIKFLSC